MRGFHLKKSEITWILENKLAVYPEKFENFQVNFGE